jgi:hypothetical protein
MKTRTQLVNRTLKELGMVPQAAENYASINELFDSLVESLDRRDVYHINSVSTDVTDATIGEDEFLPLVYCMAYAAAPEMGVQDANVLTMLAGKCEKAERDLNEMKLHDNLSRHTRKMRPDYPGVCRVTTSSFTSGT